MKNINPIIAVFIFFLSQSALAQGGFVYLYVIPGALICKYGDPEQCKEAAVIGRLEGHISSAMINVEEDSPNESKNKIESSGNGVGGSARFSVGGTISRQLAGIDLAAFVDLSSTNYALAKEGESLSMNLSNLGTGLSYCFLTSVILGPCMEGGVYLGTGTIDAKSEFDSGYHIAAGVNLNLSNLFRITSRYRYRTSSSIDHTYYYDSAIEMGMAITLFTKERK